MQFPRLGEIADVEGASGRGGVWWIRRQDADQEVKED